MNSVQQTIQLVVGRGLIFKEPNTSKSSRTVRRSNPTELVRVFRRVVEKAALLPVRFHDLRHTFATMMLGAGVPDKIISEMLGHSDIGITLRTYTHTTTDMFEATVQKMDNLLKRARKKTP